MEKSKLIRNEIVLNIEGLEVAIQMTSNKEILGKFEYAVHTLKRLLNDIDKILAE